MKHSAMSLRRRQLDERLKDLLPFAQNSRPRKGWIREIRDSSGMTAGQLAKRVDVSQPTVAKLERSEEAETISLGSLRKIAEAMNCTLVYAFVPHESLGATLTQQAERQAAKQIGRIEHSMQLEAQGRGTEQIDRERTELAQEMIRTLSRELWETEE